MTKTTHPAPKIEFGRCIFRRRNGQRCRLHVADPNSQFCPRHRTAIPRPLYHSVPALADHQPLEADLAAELGISSGEFNSDEEIYNFLGKLTFLLSANRISSRRAAVLAYITNQLLRTSCVIQKQFDADRKEDPGKIVIDVARPNRDPSNPYKNLVPSAEPSTEPS